MSEVKEILSQIRKLDPKPRVAVLGDRIDDIWWYAGFNRMTKEGGGELAVFERGGSAVVECPGGASSAVTSLSAFAAKHVIFPLSTHHRVPYSLANRFADAETGEILFRVDQTRATIPWIPPESHPADYALLSDYGRGFFSLGNLPEIAQLFKKVVFSPDHFTCMQMTQDEVEALKNCVWLVNQEEYAILWNRGLFPKNWIRTNGLEEVELRDGVPPRRRFFLVDPVAAPHYCGIGDVFAASLSAAYFCDVPLEDAIPFAIACCRVVLQSGRRGTHQLLSEDLDKIE